MALLDLFGRASKQDNIKLSASTPDEKTEPVNERLERWQKVVSLDPSSIEAVLSLCNVYRELDKADKIDELLNNLYTVHPEERNVLYAIARQHLRMHRDEEAFATWKNIDERWPDDIEALQNIGVLMVRLEQPEDALSIADRLEKFDIDRADIVRLRAYRKLERHEDVLVIVDRLAGKRELQEDEQLTRIVSTSHVQGTQAGVDLAQSVLLNDPKNASIVVELAKLLNEQESYEEALSVLESHAQTMDEVHLHAIKRINLSVRLGRLEDADNCAEQALSNSPNDKELLLAHARVAQARYNSTRDAA